MTRKIFCNLQSQRLIKHRGLHIIQCEVNDLVIFIKLLQDHFLNACLKKKQNEQFKNEKKTKLNP